MIALFHGGSFTGGFLRDRFTSVGDECWGIILLTLHCYYYYSTSDKKESIIYMLLEYAEKDLNAVIRSKLAVSNPLPMSFIISIWNEMLNVVKVGR